MHTKHLLKLKEVYVLSYADSCRSGVSVCTHSWLGVGCCNSSGPDASPPPCSDPASVSILYLEGFGLTGSLSASINLLQDLTILSLESNPGLYGGLPAPFTFPHLLWLSVEVGSR